MAYHSAYRGIATGANGEFDHFVRTIDPSHLEGGYWRFQTIDDDRRAMARGFTTPEDVLQAADSSDDRFDEIILRWVRGANDTSFKMAMSGTAHHHLQTIYELRSMLHLPMSSRGQVPLYPISTNPRLKQYWEAKYRAQRPTPIDPAIQLPERPISSPVTPGPVHSTSSQAQHAEPATPKSPIGRVTRARSAKLSQAAGPKPAAKTKSVKQRTSATALPAGQLSPTSSSLEKVKIPLPPSKAKSQQQAPSQRFETQPLIPAQPGPSISGSVPTIPRAALEWGLQSSPKQATSNASNGVSQHNWVHPSARASAVQYSAYADPPRQLAHSKSATDPSPNTTASISGVSNASNIPIRSPTSGRQDNRFAETYPGYVALRGGGNDRRDGRNAGSSANKGHKPIAAPTTPSAFDDDDSIPGVSISPHAPHNASSKTPTMGSQEVSSEDRYSPLQLPASSPAHHTEGTNIEEPIAAVGSCNTATNGQAYASRGRQQPSISDLRSLSTSDVSTLGTKAVAVAEKPVETISEPWGSYMKGLEQLPCVDCGEDEGHQLDCNLGNITPMQNLTVLDYRTLADAVEQFDPGPWTTHFVPPEPEPEDAATQMRGMAAVIRNEDSYKQDAELHGLPDDLMMMLWAFKTSDNVQVINEDDWDSGIGEFEMW
ncbi:uncharacterized protein J4E84_007583 [Alternaria hordeiaustralica]|uniref:uncharacterized protein n=1 Tax=Alternaria hordeiaustralica TaxID=1187925 RepID=UPI0020C31AE2|nr:uncharacterized protein J4E84_007583 [Alternaria hordeiaustralica]KAI4681347.1 hypothetical protein J4E84_007583 [Alternaria hordeiaustralica]